MATDSEGVRLNKYYVPTQTDIRSNPVDMEQAEMKTKTITICILGSVL